MHQAAKTALEEQLRSYIKDEIIIGVGLDWWRPDQTVLVVEAEESLYSSRPPPITDLKKARRIAPKAFKGYSVRVEPVEIDDASH
jgi:hypothetical protein